jgi:zinc D-Ala-D-Ala carboxypeptidase
MNYFKDDEFLCSCGCKEDINDELKELLNRARKIAGVPFVITSGARCKDYNRSIGSKDTSSHVRGLAVDIKATGSRERSLIINSLCRLGVTRFGIDKSFIHIDIDTSKESDVTWLY